MSEAPERIWAYAGAFKMWRSDYPSHANNPVEYLRADHVADMLKAEREKALREAAAIAQQKHDAAMEWAAESHFKELVGTDTDSSRIAAEILALITKDADNG